MKTPLSPKTAISSLGQINFRIDVGLVNALTSFAHEEDVPLDTVLLTAYQILLGRYCNTADIDVYLDTASILQHPASGTVVVSSKIDGAASFNKLLSNVHAALQTVSDKSDTISGDAVPLTKRLQGLRAPHAAAFPNFTAGFTMGGKANPIDGKDSCYVAPGQRPDSAARDLELHLKFSDTNKLEGRLIFREDFFGPDTIHCFSSHFQILLAGVAKAPESTAARRWQARKWCRHNSLPRHSCRQRCAPGSSARAHPQQTPDRASQGNGS